MKKTLYEILEVARDASAEAIRQRYQEAVDRQGAGAASAGEDAENRLKFIKQAYAVLSDPAQRAHYDASLSKPPPTAEPGYSDQLPSDPRWRHWLIGGTAAIVMLVVGSTVISYARWKPAPKAPAASVPRAPLVMVVPAEKEEPAEQQGAVIPAVVAPARVDQPTQVAIASQTAVIPVASNLSAEAIFERHSKSVAVVLGFKGGQQIVQGSGVVIRPERVITNCHVVGDADTVKVRQAARVYDARFEFGDTDPTRDLCQLLVPGLEAPAVPLGESKKLKVGRRVFALGAPLGLDLTLSEGIVSGMRSHQDAAYLQVTTPISPGSSGGALFDDAGDLVGLTTFGTRIGQNVNFAVPVEWIKELPNRPLTQFPVKSKGDPR
jgi:S1-C subfamily serine protease